MGLFRCIDMDSAYKAIHWADPAVDRGNDALRLGSAKNRRHRIS